MTLQIGALAPDFTLPADNQKTFTLSDLRGQSIVLYFYPRDNTPGCTQEACDFRDAFSSFSEKNTVILGVSKDPFLRHQKFKTKYQLPFHLLTDEKGEVCEQYGVMNPKSLFGRSFLGIQRSTFLIDKTGIIRAIWRKVKIPGHIQQVLHELNQIEH